MSKMPGPRDTETGLHHQLRDARTRIAELGLIIETEEYEIRARDERIKGLEAALRVIAQRDGYTSCNCDHIARKALSDTGSIGSLGRSLINSTRGK